MSLESPTRDGRDLLIVLWKSRLFIASFAIATTLGAGMFAWYLPTMYETTTVLSPVSDDMAGGRLSGALSQLGGLATLAGLAPPGAAARSEAIATLQSDALTQEFINANNLLPVLFHDDWDADLNTWRSTRSSPPTPWKGAELFRKRIRTVVENTKTGLVNLKITWTDPFVAAEWANKLVLATNQHLRDKALAESERNISYLNNQLTKANIVQMERVIYALMESEMRQQMLARGTEEYALKVVDQALPPERPSSPRVGLLLATGLLSGFLLSSVLVLARRALQPRS
jgi:uncharacterized protein involved in exopolysaccharide biosynthesis